MARADIITQLPLDTWARKMGINPWEFNQVGEGFPNANQRQCQYVWFQYPWQVAYLSREELANAIEMAEGMIADELGYWPAPKYFVDEVQQYPRPRDRTKFGAGGDIRGQWKSVRLNWGKVQGGGLLARTQIAAAAAVVLSDPDGDGVNETFTVTQATTVTDPDEIAIYFVSADRNAAPLDESWRIRPVRVTISGGNAVIVGNRWQLVLPDKTTIVDPLTLDQSVAANFATTVEVQRIYRDDSTTVAAPSQGTAIWEEAGCDVPPCNVSWFPICIGARDAEIGRVSIDYYLAGQNYTPDYEPDRVSLCYVAGEPLVNGQMEPTMANIVAHLATGLLPVGECGCERSDRIIAWWRDIPSTNTKGDRPLSAKEIDECPFGQTRGALWAWWQVKRLAQV